MHFHADGINAAASERHSVRGRLWWSGPHRGRRRLSVWMVR